MKKNLLYISLLIIISGTWYMLHFKEKEKHQHLTKQRHELVFKYLDKTSIQFIEMELPGERISLTQKHNHWLFSDNQLPANESYVNILLDCVAELTFGDTITRRVEDHANYQLDSQSRLLILKDSNGIEKARVYIGKPGKNYRTAFFRLGDDATVYHTVTDCYPALTRSCWYDRTIWQVVESAVTEIRILRGKETLTYNKVATDWVNTSGRHLDKKQTNGLFQLVANHAEHQEIPLNPEKRDGAIHLIAGKTTMTLWLFKSDDQYRAFRPSMPKMLYSLPGDFLHHFYVSDTENKQ